MGISKLGKNTPLISGQLIIVIEDLIFKAIGIPIQVIRGIWKWLDILMIICPKKVLDLGIIIRLQLFEIKANMQLKIISEVDVSDAV